MSKTSWRRVLACTFFCALTPVGAHAQGPPRTDAAERCADLVLAKAGRDTTPLRDSVDLLNIETVFEAVADCRFALRAAPTDKRMVEAERIASEALTLIVIGIDAPSGAEAVFARAIQECGKLRSPNKLEQRFCGFYFGSAYEYGIAVKPDTSIATKWYVLAGQAGSKIALREAARLDQSQPR